MGFVTFSYLFLPFLPLISLEGSLLVWTTFDGKLCLNYIGTNFHKNCHSCISLHMCILDSPRSTIYLCCAFVKIDTKFELNSFILNYSLNFQGFLCVSVDNCFIFCGTLFGHLSSLAHVCYGGLPKRSQSDKVCTMPKLVILDFFDLFGSFLAIWHPLHMFAMGDFQRGLRVIRYVPCQNCQPRFFKTACQTVLFSSGVTKDFETFDSNFLLHFTEAKNRITKIKKISASQQ